MIRTHKLSYTYDKKTVLTFPDISCEENSIHLILGRSGSGKTTLLHLLGGLLLPAEGDIYVDNTSIGSLRGAQLDHFRGRNIGIIFQSAHFIRSLTVMENLLLAQKLAGLPKNRKKAIDLLEKLNLDHKANAMTSRLSVGEQQRAVIARAVINDPKVILADEPTSALDDVNCDKVLDLITALSKEEKASLLIVTHDTRLKGRFDQQTVLSPL